MLSLSEDKGWSHAVVIIKAFSLLVSDVIPHFSKRKFLTVCHFSMNVFFSFFSKFYLSKFYQREA